ncbi:RHS repeat-associated core domain-containing protein [Luteibacter sp. PPL552]
MLLAGVIAGPGLARAETVTYYYTNQQGTVLAIADASGNILSTADYRPYGVQTLGTAEAGPGYTGHVNDPGSGLVYMQARYYDPVVGRFLSIDPKAASAGSNIAFSRYAYSGNNPVGNVDPDGRQTLPSSVYQLNWQDPTTREVASNYALNMIPGYGAYACASQGCSGGGWALAGLGALPVLGMAREIGVAGRIAEQVGETRTLYRAVSPQELANIQETGRFVLAQGLESKYFASSSADVSKFAKMAVASFGDEAYTTVATEVPLSVLNSAERASVDGGIDAYILNESQLQGLKPIILDHMDLPNP